MLRSFFLISVFLLSPVWALTIDEKLPSAEQEARARALFQEIRCVVCQSEAIADSPAEIARDMRRAIRERIATGDSDEAIKAYLVSRYGDYILMQPPFKSSTLLLWLGPLLILTLAFLLARTRFRRAP